MSGYKCKIFLLVVLSPLFSMQAFSQQINYGDSIPRYTPKANFKPEFHYSIGSSFMFIPKVGSVTGVTLSSSLSIPISPKLSVDGGIIARHYYSTLPNFNREGSINGTFNEISLFGSAIYHVNPQLSIYGIGIKQLTSTSPYSILPKSSYSIGSNYNFGHFSVGVSVQMSKWNDISTPLPFNGSQGFYSPY
jgi:hypothetical protein